VTDQREQVRPLLQTRQTRDFTDQPIDDASLAALADVARWSGSSANTQPWRFIVVRDPAALQGIAAAGMPQTRSFATATAGIVITMPDESSRAISHAFDEGRAAERMLVGATMLGLGAAIAWLVGDARKTVGELLGIPADRKVRTVVALGHPSEAGRRPHAAPGQARLPREDVVFDDRWPAD
jgi:nitroreductase